MGREEGAEYKQKGWSDWEYEWAGRNCKGEDTRKSSSGSEEDSFQHSRREGSYIFFGFNGWTLSFDSTWCD